jgi:predicted nucleic acid-binding protein
MTTSVYIESSVISYLTARASRDLVSAARQTITQEWWENRRSLFDVYISALVEEEISNGDPFAARQRLEAVNEIPSLDISAEAQQIAEYLVSSRAVPKNSPEDALHIGIAAANGIDFLLTWNFKHINNAQTKARIEEIIEQHDLVCPVLCSPEELGA